MVATLIVGVLGASLGAMVGALIVQLLTPKIVGFRPRYWDVYLAVMIPTVGLYLIAHFLPEPSNLFLIIILVTAFLIHAGFLVFFVKGKEGQKISYKQAILLCIAWLLIGITLLVGFLSAPFLVSWL